jgi:hypothetical protein
LAIAVPKRLISEPRRPEGLAIELRNARTKAAIAPALRLLAWPPTVSGWCLPIAVIGLIFIKTY